MHGSVASHTIMAVLCRLTVVLLLAVCSSAKIRGRLVSRCEKLNISLCQGMGYTSTVFPNPLTKILTQEKTADLAKLYRYIPNVNCTTTDPLAFVCSVYAPKCYRRERNLVVPPCREFCQQAAGNCPQVFGVFWPETLDCNKYPRADRNKPCIKDVEYNIANPRARKANSRGKKISRCCRLGRKAAKKHLPCDTDEKSATSTPQEIAFRKWVAEKCPGKESIVRDCCLSVLQKKAGHTGQKEHERAEQKMKGSKRKSKGRRKGRKGKRMKMKQTGKRAAKKLKKTNG